MKIVYTFDTSTPEAKREYNIFNQAEKMHSMLCDIRHNITNLEIDGIKDIQIADLIELFVSYQEIHGIEIYDQ